MLSRVSNSLKAAVGRREHSRRRSHCDGDYASGAMHVIVQLVAAATLIMIGYTAQFRLRDGASLSQMGPLILWCRLVRLVAAAPVAGRTSNAWASTWASVCRRLRRQYAWGPKTRMCREVYGKKSNNRRKIFFYKNKTNYIGLNSKFYKFKYLLSIILILTSFTLFNSLLGR